MQPTVLLIDDNATTIANVCQVVEPAGCKLVLASNAKDALIQCEQETPVLLLISFIIPPPENVNFIRDLDRRTCVPDWGAFILLTEEEMPAMEAMGHCFCFCNTWGGYILNPKGLERLPAILKRMTSENDERYDLK